LSVLGASIKPKSDTHSFETPESGVCIYYDRDRGEIGIDSLKFKDIKKFLKLGFAEEYNYIFKDGEWYTWNASDAWIASDDLDGWSNAKLTTQLK
jgi:hypothetical protein